MEAKPEIEILTVSSRAQLKAFLRLPETLYSRYKGYTPPLRLDRASLIDPKKSRFLSKNSSSFWLATRGGEVVGRISAHLSADTPNGLPGRTGFFGCLDVEDNLETASRLFAAAEAWLLDKKCEYAFGPCCMSMNEEVGLMIEGFDQPAMTMVPWHPPYVAALVEANGYAKRRDLQNWCIDPRTVRDNGCAKRVLKDALGPNCKVRPLDMRKLDRDINIICDIYNDAWRDNDLFTPIRPEELDAVKKELRPLLPPEACTIIEIDGVPAGVAFIMPNLFELFSDIGPSPSVLQWLNLAYRTFTHRFRSGRIILMGVSRQYRDTIRGFSIAICLVEALLENQKKFRGEYVEAGWVLENNIPLIKLLTQFGFTPTKRFRLYFKPLASWTVG